MTACRQLLRAGFLLWICSYIGKEGADSFIRRRNAEENRQWLARELGLNPEKVYEPTVGCLYMCICDAKTWQGGNSEWVRGLNFNGKAAALRYFQTSVLVDDNLEICDECITYGIVAYKVKPSSGRSDKGKGKGKRKGKDDHVFRAHVLEDNDLPHPELDNFTACARQLIQERGSGELFSKINFVEANYDAALRNPRRGRQTR